MASIRCAWGHVHATVAEVRACAEAHRDEEAPGDTGGLVDDRGTDGDEWFADAGSVAVEPAVVVGASIVAGPDIEVDPAHAAGPDWLGRDAIVDPGQEVPAPWTDAPRVVVDGELLSRLAVDPVAVLHPIWRRRHARRRTVFVLADRDLADRDLADPNRPGTVMTGAVWHHPPDLLLGHDILADLVTSNAVDLRPGRPPWPWANRAIGAGARPGGLADVVLPDGTPAWCDGGPPARFDAAVTGGAAVVHRVAVERGSLTPMPTRCTTSSHPSWHPTSSRRWPIRAVRPASSRRPAPARRGC